jgi:hypothetical protein
MFFRALKHKKIADAVLDQVQPFLGDVGRLLGAVPVGLPSDKYVLGFFCANIILEMQRVGAGSLDHVGKGTVLFLILQRLFGKGAVNEKEIGNLLNGLPTPNTDFQRGCDAAGKIQAAVSGRHKLQNDPDYLAAREVVRKAGSSLDLLNPGASEDSKIGGEMLRALYYQHLIEHHQKTHK